MEREFFLRDVDGWETDDALVEAIERSDQLAFRIVRYVQLIAQAHAVGFESALPQSFHRKLRVVGFMRGRLTPERKRKRGAALGPSAVDEFMVWRNFAFELGADGVDFEVQCAGGQSDGAGFYGEYTLVEAVEGGVELAAGSAGEMEDEMELRIAGLEGAGVGAVEWGRFGRGSGRLRMGCRCLSWNSKRRGKKAEVRED